MQLYSLITNFILKTNVLGFREKAVVFNFIYSQLGNFSEFNLKKTDWQKICKIKEFDIRLIYKSTDYNAIQNNHSEITFV